MATYEVTVQQKNMGGLLQKKAKRETRKENVALLEGMKDVPRRTNKSAKGAPRGGENW